jgi:hypothetical protein
MELYGEPIESGILHFPFFCKAISAYFIVQVPLAKFLKVDIINKTACTKFFEVDVTKYDLYS